MVEDLKTSPVPFAGSGEKLDDFIRRLEDLKVNFPWTIILDDLDGEVDISELDGDTPENYLVNEYNLSYPTLEAGNVQLDRVAQGILDGTYANICFVNGAGISVNSGIADYRGKGGMYDTIQPEALTATSEIQEKIRNLPEYVVDILLFQETPLPYYEQKRQMIIDCEKQKYFPSLSHCFMKLCEQKGLLRRIYTQNIDGLELLSGIKEELVVEVHGNLRKAVCFYCKEQFPIALLIQKLKENIRDIHCLDFDAPLTSSCFDCPSCGKPGLKTSTVLFNEPLPDLYQKQKDIDFPSHCDLLIVSGTSLVVHPVNELITSVKHTSKRLLINKTVVGKELGIVCAEPPLQDFFYPGDCDAAFLYLSRKLGWESELRELFKTVSNKS